MVTVPPGAFPDCAKIEQQLATKTLGSSKPAFDSRAKSLTSMRNVTNDLAVRVPVMEKSLKQIQEDLLRRPF